MSSLVLSLLDASSRAHTERTLLEAALGVLGPRLRVCSLELRFEARHIAAEDGIAVAFVAVPLSADLGGELRIGYDGAVPDAGSAAEIGAVMSAALRQVRTLAAVAERSRHAHVLARTLDEDLRTGQPADVVAVASASRYLFERVLPLVARQDTRVVILGETGTGKELVARRIHELSRRARRPFVGINCGAIPTGLAESTLFGHERGAFTGAARRHAGVFERAHGGTLFLDEIGELPLDAQAKLLRVLETGQVERLGSERPIRVDVRIVAATHRDLEGMAAHGQFREDLFHRLAVVPIRLPPLRERRADIAPLARHIVERIARRLGRAPPPLDRRTLARLERHGWPGNVRELENVLERSMLFAEGDVLSLALAERGSSVGPPSFEESSRRAIRAALAAAGGRIHGPRGAAALLGLKPTTLASKMKRLGVERRG